MTEFNIDKARRLVLEIRDEFPPTPYPLRALRLPRDVADQLEASIATIQRLEAVLHASRLHPDYEYDTTRGPRKDWDVEAPSGDGWEANRHLGRDGWERFDFHEEAYWMRRKP